MSERDADEAVPDRVGRAFRDHGSFERADEATFEATTTPFDGRVAVAPAGEGRTRYEVTVRVPTLGATTADAVADVVEEGWFETFERRIESISGVTRGDHDLSPTVEERGREAVVEASFEEIDERRGADDAAAVVDYVEGTFVQGIVPGYEYVEPASGLISRAREAAGDREEQSSSSNRSASRSGDREA